MPKFEDCAKCGELRVEHYGAVTENKCVACAAIERRALAKVSGTVSTGQQQHNTIDDAFFPLEEQRRQIRIMTLISGRFKGPNSAHDFNILDISKSGAKLRTAQALPNGVFTLAFPGVGTLHATPAWQEGSVGGVAFVESQDDVVATIGKAMPALEPVLRAA